MSILTVLKQYRVAMQTAYTALLLLPPEYQQALDTYPDKLPEYVANRLALLDALIEQAREDARATLRAERAAALAVAAQKYVSANVASLPADVAEGLQIAVGDLSIDEIKLSETEELK